MNSRTHSQIQKNSHRDIHNHDSAHKRWDIFSKPHSLKYNLTMQLSWNFARFSLARSLVVKDCRYSTPRATVSSWRCVTVIYGYMTKLLQTLGTRSLAFARLIDWCNYAVWVYPTLSLFPWAITPSGCRLLPSSKELSTITDFHFMGVECNMPIGYRLSFFFDNTCKRQISSFTANSENDCGVFLEE